MTWYLPAKIEPVVNSLIEVWSVWVGEKEVFEGGPSWLPQAAQKRDVSGLS
jgi:hypothetical protein